MSILYFLIPFSLFLAICGLCAFIWSVKTGQFSDVDRSHELVLDSKSIRVAKTSDVERKVTGE